MRSTPRICLQWPRFGPLHLARLRATHGHFLQRGVEVVGLETAGDDALYEWRVETAEEAFPRLQVFPDAVFEEVPPHIMHERTLETLDALDPEAVGIMSWGYPDGRAALTWCLRKRRTAILMTSSKESDAPRVWWRELIKGRIIRQFDSAVVGGTPQIEYARKLGLPRDVIFGSYNAVDNAYFAAGAESARNAPEQWSHLPGLEGREPYFLASNRFIERKNLKRLLMAYRAYRERATSAGLSPWRLLMLGDGRLRDRLEGLVRKHDIDGVVFCGFRQIDELPAYYAFAGALVHPAEVDQWALVVNEAMAAGLPVIVSTGAGCHVDLVDQGVNGYRFEPHDTDRLTEALFAVADPSTDRTAMGRRSLEIIEKWSPARFAESMWQAYAVGRARARRIPDPSVTTLLWAINRFTGSHRAFHTVEV